MNRRPDELAALAASLLADEPPPPRVHDSWRGDAGARHIATGPGTGGGRLRGRGSRFAAFAAAAALAVIVAAGASFLWVSGDRGTTASESGEGAAPDVEVELAAVAPAIGGAMGERDISSLRDPAALRDCLAAHGEDADALLGAAPATVDGRVRQLFILASGIPGQVSVLLVSEGCGREPGPPLVHDTIGAPR